MTGRRFFQGSMRPDLLAIIANRSLRGFQEKSCSSKSMVNDSRKVIRLSVSSVLPRGRLCRASVALEKLLPVRLVDRRRSLLQRGSRVAS